jgi:toxin ParE1/3/4
MTARWLSTALQNIEEIAEYIAIDNPARAMSFLQEIREKTKMLENFPNI